MLIKKLIIHPGIGKTATSAIQYQLHRLSGLNFDGMRYIYPEFGLDENFAHHYLAESHPSFNIEVFEKHMEDIKAGVRLETASLTYVISSEFLAHCSKDFIDEFIKNFREVFDEVVVVYAVRNYVDLIYSSYLQAVKVNYGVNNSESILHYAERMGGGFDLPLLFKKWSSADSVFYINYDIHRENFVETLLTALGFNVLDIGGLSTKNNLSIIEDVVNLIFNFDKVESNLNERNRFIENMLSFSKNNKEYSSRFMWEELNYIYRAKWDVDYNEICSAYKKLA